VIGYKAPGRLIGGITLALMIIGWSGACQGQSSSSVEKEEDGSSATIPAPLPSSTVADQTQTHMLPDPLPTGTETPPSTSKAAMTRYTLIAAYDETNASLNVDETTIFTNNAPITFNRLPLVVEANRFADAFHLGQVSWEPDGMEAKHTLGGNILWLDLAKPLAPNQQVELNLSYHLKLPHGVGPLSMGARQVNFGDWYPFIPAYLADGWALDEPGRVGEHLTYPLAAYHVEIRLEHPADDLIVAASTPASIEGDRRVFDATARNFTWSASRDYRVLEGNQDGHQVTAYVFPEHVPAGRAALETTLASLRLYGELFGSYPHSSLALVESEFPDGMEYDGLYFLGQEYFAEYRGGQANYLTSIAAHETAHQWWGGLVGNDPARDPWLDESLATYSELLYYEKNYPELVDWWWSFRVNRFQPVGEVDQPVYAFTGFRPYVDAVYLRGALFWEAVRKRIGEQAFFSFLREYVRQYDGKIASPSALFSILSKTAPSMDVSDVYAQYLRGSYPGESEKR
jgi:hypothetical protein